MFEHKTFESILQDMLDRVPNDLDKREGSVIYDALAPTAMELAQVYSDMDLLLRCVFADTADGEFLEERVSESGVFRKNAVHAIKKGEFYDSSNTLIDVPIGSRFMVNELFFRVVEQISKGVYQLECETGGAVGNDVNGEILPVENITGLAQALLTDTIVYGEDEETDEQLRERFRQSLIDPAQDGNIAQYKEWAIAFPGIGVAKVFPLWNGGNTVKVAITNANFQVAEQSLVDAFQEHLDPNSEGLGNGVAPAGSKVTVSGGVSKDINIAGNVILAEGYTEPEGVAEAIRSYLASITYLKNTVSYMRIGATIIDTPSIAELNNLTINGGTIDIALVGEEIPTLNSINLTAV